VEILNEYSNRYGADHEIRQLQSELEKSATNQKREEDILSLIDDITTALDDDRLETASHIAVAAQANYPDETRILVLVEQVRAEFAARQREAALEGIVRDVASLTLARRFGRAIEVANEAIDHFGQEEILLEARRSAVAARDARDRRLDTATPEPGNTVEPLFVPTILPAATDYKFRRWPGIPKGNRVRFGLASAGVLLVLAGAAKLTPRSRPPEPHPQTPFERKQAMEPAAPTPKAGEKSEGTLVIKAPQPGVEILLDGRSFGRTDKTGTLWIRARGRRYRLAARAAGFIFEGPREVEIRNGQVEQMPIRLKPEPQSVAASKALPNTETPAAAPKPASTANPREARSPSATVSVPAEPLPIPPPPSIDHPIGAAYPPFQLDDPNHVPRTGALESRRGAADQQAVFELLGKYERAVRDRDLNAMQALWPEMPGTVLNSWKKAFREKQVKYQVRLTPLGSVNMTGDSGTIDCERMATTQVGESVKSAPPTRIRVTVERKPQGWILRDLQELHTE
jgi:hypothetical protein